MKSKKFILPLALALAGGAVLSGCNKGEKNPENPDPTPTPTQKTDYDMSKVTFADKEVDYSGSVITMAVEGELPAGLSVSYKYYSDEEIKSEVASVVDAGVYYCLASFTGDAQHNPVQPKKAKLTVNKIDAEMPEFELKAYFGEEQSKLAQTDNDKFYVELENANKFSFKAFKKDSQEEIVLKYFDKDGQEIAEPEGDERIGAVDDVQAFGFTVAGDKNHNPIEYKSEVYVSRKTMRVSTFDDLEMMAKHTKSGDNHKDPLERWETRYLLVNDIDCEGKVWDASNFGMDNDNGDHIMFCSELDGSGHAIKNLQLSATPENSDSVYFEGVTGEGDLATLAFIPVVNSAYIHNITFEDFKYTVDKDVDLPAGLITAGIHIGVVGVEKFKHISLTDKHQEFRAMDILVKNPVVEAKHGYDFTACESKGYYNTISGFLGLANNGASTKYDATVADASQFINVDVQGMKVNYDMAAGKCFVGGVIGYCAWEKNVFRDCDVTDAEWHLTNRGAAIPDNTLYTDPLYQRKGAGNGSFFSVGTIYGGSYKAGASWSGDEITARKTSVIDHCTASVSVECFANSKGNLVAGKLIGLNVRTIMVGGTNQFEFTDNDCSLSYVVKSLAETPVTLASGSASVDFVSGLE